MTDQDLPPLLEQYRAGLAAEIAILHKLQTVALHQHEATGAHDLGALERAADARDSLMLALVTIESNLRPVRDALSAAREEARQLDGYEDAAILHAEAMTLVAGILRRDTESLDALAHAELARREAVRAVEQGETTLAAYRRAMAALPGATLVDRRG